MVMKIAANSSATSTIGPQENMLRRRTARGVIITEIRLAASQTSTLRSRPIGRRTPGSAEARRRPGAQHHDRERDRADQREIGAAADPERCGARRRRLACRKHPIEQIEPAEQRCGKQEER